MPGNSWGKACGKALWGAIIGAVATIALALFIRWGDAGWGKNLLGIFAALATGSTFAWWRCRKSAPPA